MNGKFQVTKSGLSYYRHRKSNTHDLEYLISTTTLKTYVKNPQHA